MVVETFNLTKHYGDFVALDSLSLQVGKGQILGFIGPNGSGKTTTIRILVGLLKPTSGYARIAGADCLQDAGKIRRMVGYMPDDFAAYNNMRVNEYLDFFGAAYGIGRKPRLQRIDEVLEITSATHMKDLFVDALSRGMQQKVAIARTLMHDPQVMILDEPANGLDPQARIEMRGMLMRLAELGKTLIVTSHILPELARVCDLVAMITKGRLRAFGTLDDIMRNVKQRRTFELLVLEHDQVEMAANRVRDWLATHPVDEAVEASDVTGSTAEMIVRFTTRLSDPQLAPLLTHLVGQGQSVAQFREVMTDLEDAFLCVAGADDAADDVASASRTAAVAGESRGDNS
ncbi:putative ABC transporter ATP-binding protein YbhF [Novipirellula artificiosorum]|uniref:Putative ABC transporter ATP-binding protein YbhF n=1 Tax=Novipirellula artificiosorum TaxID=2528016 RepID=A0A5C6E029_9BACT|nr:putative ABC transporter ATP-binding protein YbhF [Novipirellula artificiosorum]